MQGAIHPTYQVLPDLGRELIPNIRTWFGKSAPYIWWGGSMTEEIYGALLILTIILRGKALRWGLAFATVTLLHCVFWHFTIIPIPPDILWQFPLTSGQVPRPDDF
jgi:hypothetical protein